jgi:protoporphyrinogen oxidase
MIVIIGAGISGITAASHISHPVTILEKENQIGGLSGQYTVDGYDFDYGGHYFHFQKNPQILNYLQNYCSFEKFKRNSKSLILGKMVPYPVQLHLAYLPRRIRESILDEIYARQKQTHNNLYDHLEHNFGPTLFKLFFRPFLKKYYQTDLKEMLANMDRGSIPIPTVDQVVKGSMGRKFKESGYNPVFYYPRESLKGFIKNYAGPIIPRIHLGEEATEINLIKKTVRTKRGIYHYTHLINTMPLKSFLQRITPPPDHPLPRQMQHSSTLVANMVLKRRRKRFHWVYLADKEIPFYRLGFYPRRSEIMGYLEKTLKPGESPVTQDLIRQVHFTLKKLKVIEEVSEILHLNFKVIPISYIIFNKAWPKTIPPLLEYLRQNCIYSIGRYGSWNYSSMSEDTEEALATADWLNRRS